MKSITFAVPKSFVALAAVAWLVGCASVTPTTESEPALAGHHTTCLKRGFPADSKEHTDCVLALHEAEKERLGRLGKAAPSTGAATTSAQEPAKPESGY